MTEVPKHIEVTKIGILIGLAGVEKDVRVSELTDEEGTAIATAAATALVEAGFAIVLEGADMRDLRRRVIAATLEAAAKRGDRERIAYDEEADAAIAVVLEEAAKVAIEKYRMSCSGEEIAAAIRAMRT
jgi:hypothetical protein